MGLYPEQLILLRIKGVSGVVLYCIALLCCLVVYHVYIHTYNTCSYVYQASMNWKINSIATCLMYTLKLCDDNLSIETPALFLSIVQHTSILIPQVFKFQHLNHTQIIVLMCLIVALYGILTEQLIYCCKLTDISFCIVALLWVSTIITEQLNLVLQTNRYISQSIFKLVCNLSCIVTVCLGDDRVPCMGHGPHCIVRTDSHRLC